MSPEYAALLARVDQLSAEVTGLRERVTWIERRLPSHTDTEVAAILAAILAVIADHTFTVRQLLDHARLDVKGPLHKAIVAAVGELNGRRLGWFLLGIEGKDYHGISVERLQTDDRVGANWILRIAAGFEMKPARCSALPPTGTDHGRVNTRSRK